MKIDGARIFAYRCPAKKVPLPQDLQL